MKYTPRLKVLYKETVVGKLKEKFKYKNHHQVPKVTKVVVNSVGKDVAANPKLVESLLSDFELITGQKPVPARAKKSIATFKLREGQPIGVYVTLRGNKMYEFIDRFINFSLPRVKDFRGLNPKAFNGFGACTLGIKEQIIFPEINFDKLDKIRGLAITFETTATSSNETRELLTEMGFPFKK